MGRRKIEIKKLENLRNRKSTFKKRRQGILKKAHELAVLTDSKVTLMIKNGQDFENHVFNDLTQSAAPAHSPPMAATEASQIAKDGWDTPSIGEINVEDIVVARAASDATPQWSFYPVNADFGQDHGSTFDAIASNATMELCGYGLDISPPSLGTFSYAALEDSPNDPCLSVTPYDDSNWLLPMLQFKPIAI